MTSFKACGFPNPSEDAVSEPDPWKIRRRVWEIGWGGSVPNGMYGICNY